jgi:aspartate kinase
MAYQKPSVVVKYGGSAFRSADDYHAVIEHQQGIYRSGKVPACVNSARSGASDRLMKVWKGDIPLEHYAQEEEEFFSGVFQDRKDKDAFMKDIRGSFADMKSVLDVNQGKYSDSHRESYVISHGETETGKALQYLLSDLSPGIRFLDGHEAGIIAKHMRGPVDTKRSIENIRKRQGNFCYGGFVGTDKEKGGSYTLLDRNSTDVTAALVAAALSAEEYWNIKDVDGVYVCDPSLTDNGDKPPIIRKLSYGEAANIIRGGSPVIHPTGIIISEDNGVKIVIKNMNGGNGTEISKTTGTTREKPYAAISGGICASLTVNDSEMDVTGVGRGYAADIMRIIADSGYDIKAPTGPGNSMSIVIAGGNEVNKGSGVKIDDSCLALTRGLRSYDRNGVVAGDDAGYIAIAGDGIRNRKGVVREIASAMDDAEINIIGISYGDERHVKSPVFGFWVSPEDYRRAVNALLKKLF